MVGGAVVERDVRVGGRVVGVVRRVEDAGGAAGEVLAADFVAHRVGDEAVPAVHDLLEERGRDGVDEVGGEDAGGLEVHGVHVAALEVVERRALEVEVAPELGGVDAGILDLRERELVRVDVVHREEAGDAHAARGGGDEAGHPVVAVDEVGLHLGDHVVDHLALEREGELRVAVAARVDVVAVVEAAVLGEVDALARHAALVEAQLVGDELAGLLVEHPPVVRQGHVDVRPQVEQRPDERRRHVGHAARLGAHAPGEVAHPLREIRDLRRDDQDARVFLVGFGFLRACS